MKRVVAVARNFSNPQTYTAVQHSFFDFTEVQADMIFVKEFFLLLDIAPLFLH
jgi:hypothetical protein